MSGVVALVLVALIALPAILDGPTHTRRRRGITVWDEAWARGEITAAQLYEIKRKQREWEQQ